MFRVPVQETPRIVRDAVSSSTGRIAKVVEKFSLAFSKGLAPSSTQQFPELIVAKTKPLERHIIRDVLLPPIKGYQGYQIPLIFGDIF